tara:strand:+ start:238 stop:4941 length:4704 start_codon:yes stop_codon:yes gene_type:complete
MVGGDGESAALGIDQEMQDFLAAHGESTDPAHTSQLFEMMAARGKLGSRSGELLAEMREHDRDIQRFKERKIPTAPLDESSAAESTRRTTATIDEIDVEEWTRKFASAVFCDAETASVSIEKTLAENLALDEAIRRHWEAKLLQSAAESESAAAAAAVASDDADPPPPPQRRPLKSLSQAELEQWLAHPTVGEAESVPLLRAVAEDEGGEVTGMFFEDSDLEEEQFLPYVADPESPAAAASVASMWATVQRARSEGVDAALLATPPPAASVPTEMSAAASQYSVPMDGIRIRDFEALVKLVIDRPRVFRKTGAGFYKKLLPYHNSPYNCDAAAGPPPAPWFGVTAVDLPPLSSGSGSSDDGTLPADAREIKAAVWDNVKVLLLGVHCNCVGKVTEFIPGPSGDGSDDIYVVESIVEGKLDARLLALPTLGWEARRWPQCFLDAKASDKAWQKKYNAPEYVWPSIAARAVRLELFASQFERYPDFLTTDDAVKLVIMPRCARVEPDGSSGGCSYCDLLEEEGVCVRAPSTQFVSFVFKYDFRAVVETLRAWIDGGSAPLELGSVVRICDLQKTPGMNGQRGRVVKVLATGRLQVKILNDSGKTFSLKRKNLRSANAAPLDAANACRLWFSPTTINQYDACAGKMLTPYWFNLFKTTIRDIGWTLPIMMPWRAPINLTRAWCVYEVYETVDADVQSTFLLPEREKRDMLRALVFEFDTLAYVVGKIALQDAEGSPPSRDVIIDMAKKRGMTEINGLVCKAMREWLASEGWAELARRGEDAVDSATLQFVTRMAQLMGVHGNMDAMVLLCRRVLAANEQLHGSTHPGTISACVNLGNALVNAGKPEEAEEFSARAMKELSRPLSGGRTSEAALSAKANEALRLKRLGKLAEAEPLYLEVISGYESMFGSVHDRTLCAKNNLGTLLSAQGRLSEAEDMYRAVLAAREKHYGRDSQVPDMLSSIGNLGALLVMQNKFEEAESLLKRSYEGNLTTLGATHPDTIAAESGLGYVRMMNRSGDAQIEASVVRKSLAKLEATLGPSHRRTIAAVLNLAQFLHLNSGISGNLLEAESLARRAVEARTNDSSLGPSHNDTLLALMSQADILQTLGRLDQSATLFQQILACCTDKGLLDTHPITSKCVSSLSSVLYRQGDDEEANAMEQRWIDGAGVELFDCVFRNKVTGRGGEFSRPQRAGEEGYARGVGEDHAALRHRFCESSEILVAAQHGWKVTDVEVRVVGPKIGPLDMVREAARPPVYISYSGSFTAGNRALSQVRHHTASDDARSPDPRIRARFCRECGARFAMQVPCSFDDIKVEILEDVSTEVDRSQVFDPEKKEDVQRWIRSFMDMSGCAAEEVARNLFRISDGDWARGLPIFAADFKRTGQRLNLGYDDFSGGAHTGQRLNLGYDDFSGGAHVDAAAAGQMATARAVKEEDAALTDVESLLAQLKSLVADNIDDDDPPNEQHAPVSPPTMAALSALDEEAKALYSAKNFEAAVAPHRALWEGRALLLGDAASGTLTAACNLIRVLLKVNRKDEAETLCAAELEKSRSALGADDAVTKKLSKLLAKARM